MKVGERIGGGEVEHPLEGGAAGGEGTGGLLRQGGGESVDGGIELVARPPPG